MPQYKGKHYPYTPEGHAQKKRDMEKDQQGADKQFQSWLSRKMKTARQDELARVPYEQREGSGGGGLSDLMKLAREAYGWSPAAAAEDLYTAYKDPSLENVGWAALGAVPGGRPAKKLAKIPAVQRLAEMSKSVPVQRKKLKLSGKMRQVPLEGDPPVQRKTLKLSGKMKKVSTDETLLSQADVEKWLDAVKNGEMSNENFLELMESYKNQ